MESKLLSIDLSNMSYEVTEIPAQVMRRYIGGRGLGAYLLCNSVPPKADPLGPENHLIFAAGPGHGTNLPYSSKNIVTTKSPQTGIYLYSVASGTFSTQIRKAGFWAIDIKGIAESPLYIAINNGNVEFRDASHLWGMETNQTQQAMLGSMPQKDAAAIAIGPAGEKLIKYASILAAGPLYRCFARGGTGCVMGSKKLKGIVISGDNKIEVADKRRFETVRKQMLEKVVAERGWVEPWRLYGTGQSNEMYSRLGALPTRNWQEGQFEGWRGIDTAATVQEWPRKNRNCGPYCLTPCAHYAEIKKGPYKGAHCDGPEYETIYAFGANCGVDKLDAIIAANQICDEQGIDTMSAALSLSFAMECFERGLVGLKDTDGIELRFGDDQAMMAMLRKIINLEGFGRQLAQGAKRLSQEIPGSESFAMHAKGMELGGYECRALMGQALQYAVSSIGGCHHTYGVPAHKEMTDGSGTQVQGKGELIKKLGIDRIVRDSIVTCSFVGRIATEAMLPDIVSALVGEPWSADDLRQVGIRVMCQERLFNMREGLTRQDDTLPKRLLNEPKPDGPNKGTVVPLEELKDDFYQAMGWDVKTGNPPESVLAKLGIEKP